MPGDIEDRMNRCEAEIVGLRKANHDHRNEQQVAALLLNDIKRTLQEQDKAFAQHRDEAKARAEEVKSLLHGTTKDPGLLIRQDRVEQTVGGYSRFLWIIAGIVASLVIVAVAKGLMK